MATEIRRDILLAFRTAYDGAGAQAALRDMQRLRAEAQGLASGRSAAPQVIRTSIDQTRQAVISTKEHTAAQRSLAASVEKTGDSFAGAAGKFATWTAAGALVFGSIRTIQSGIRSFSELEAASVSLERVGRGFGATAEEIRQGSRNVSDEVLRLAASFGASSKDALEASLTFARLGLTQRETIEATRVALLASNVVGLEAEQVSKDLASAMSQFQLSARDLPDLLNKLNTLENTTRVRTADLLGAIGRAGAVFREAGGSFEQFAATVASVSEATGRSGAEIGNAIRTIATRLGNPELQGKIFERTGVAIKDMEGNLLPINQLIGQLVVSFNRLSEAERAEVSQIIAGNFQRNRFISILDTYFQAQTQVIRQLESKGSAEAENALVVQTLRSKTEQLVASFDRLAVTLGDNGVGQALKAIVGGLTGVVNGFASLGPLSTVAAAGMTLYTGSVLLTLTRVGSLSGGMIGLLNAVRDTNLAIGAAIGIVARLPGTMAPAAAATAGLRGAFVGLKEAAYGAAAAAKPLVLLAAPIAAVAGAVALIRTFTGAGEQIDPFDPESSAGFRRNFADDDLINEKNLARARKETAALAKTAADLLKDSEGREAKGIALTARQLEVKKQALKAIGELSILDAREREKINAGIFKSADAYKLAERAARGENGELASLNFGILTRKKILKDLAEEAARQNRLDRDRGTDLTFFARGPRGFFESSDAFLNENRKKQEAIRKEVRDLENQRSELKSRQAAANAAQAKELADEEFAQSSEIAKKRIEELKTFVSGRFFLEIGVETNPLNKARLALEENLGLIRAIEKEKSLSFSEDRDEELVKLKRQTVEIERQISLQRLQDTLRTRSRRDDLGLGIRDNIAEARALLNPEEDQRGVRRAQAQVQAEEATLERLRRLRVQLFRQSQDSGSSAEDRAEESRIAQAIQSSEELLENRKVDLIKAQLDGLRQVTAERRRQQEEIRKELSGLSDLELARARILATRLRDGSLQGITEQQFLTADQESRQFLSRANNLFPDQDLIPKLDFGLGAASKDEKNLEDLIRNIQLNAPEELRGQIQNAILDAQNIQFNAPAGDIPDAAKDAVGGPGFDRGITVNANADGFGLPLERIGNALALRMASVIEEKLGEFEIRLHTMEGKIKRPGSRAPVRA